MREDLQDGIQDRIQLPGQILCQETENEESVLLQERILLPIPPGGLDIRQVSRSIRFDHQASIGT